MELKVVSDDGDLLRLEAAGRIVEADMPADSEILRDLLGPHGYGRNVLVNLAGVHFIDSNGLSWLVVCHKRFCQAGGKLVLHSAPPPIMELFTLMRLDHAFHLANNEAAALELVRQ